MMDRQLGSDEQWKQLGTDLGVDLDDKAIALLRRYGHWLIDEAIPAGAVGPDEADRLFDRHLADALTYLTLIPSESATLLDVGSGAGLPGVPVAISRPDLSVTVVDRADRRTWLTRRAVRILGIDVDVVTGDVHRHGEAYDVLTFRASLPLPTAAALVQARPGSGTVGVFGVSRGQERPSVPEPPPAMSTELVQVTSAVLDSPAWLLRMQGVELGSHEESSSP